MCVWLTQHANVHEKQKLRSKIGWEWIHIRNVYSTIEETDMFSYKM